MEKSKMVVVVKGQKKVSANKKDECNFKEWKSVSQGCIHIFQGKLKCLYSSVFEKILLKKTVRYLGR